MRDNLAAWILWGGGIAAVAIFVWAWWSKLIDWLRAEDEDDEDWDDEDEDELDSDLEDEEDEEDEDEDEDSELDRGRREAVMAERRANTKTVAVNMKDWVFGRGEFEPARVEQAFKEVGEKIGREYAERRNRAFLEAFTAKPQKALVGSILMLVLACTGCSFTIQEGAFDVNVDGCSASEACCSCGEKAANDRDADSVCCPPGNWLLPPPIGGRGSAYCAHCGTDVSCVCTDRQARTPADPPPPPHAGRNVQPPAPHLRSDLRDRPCPTNRSGELRRLWQQRSAEVPTVAGRDLRRDRQGHRRTEELGCHVVAASAPRAPDARGRGSSGGVRCHAERVPQAGPAAAYA